MSRLSLSVVVLALASVRFTCVAGPDVEDADVLGVWQYADSFRFDDGPGGCSTTGTVEFLPDAGVGPGRRRATLTGEASCYGAPGVYYGFALRDRLEYEVRGRSVYVVSDVECPRSGGVDARDGRRITGSYVDPESDGAPGLPPIRCDKTGSFEMTRP